jgi:hypothetical protein
MTLIFIEKGRRSRKTNWHPSLSLTLPHSQMIARLLNRSTRLARPNMMRRGGGGGMPINEPGGYLFNEKVRSIVVNLLMATAAATKHSLSWPRRNISILTWIHRSSSTNTTWNSFFKTTVDRLFLCVSKSVAAVYIGLDCDAGILTTVYYYNRLTSRKAGKISTTGVWVVGLYWFLPLSITSLILGNVVIGTQVRNRTLWIDIVPPSFW